MASFKAFATDVEASGDCILSTVQAMASFQRIAVKLLAKHGICDVQASLWYRQQAWLDTFRTIAERIGNHTLFSIGLRIPETAIWPAQIDTLDKGLASIDVAYHLNHRRKGVILFDERTGVMREGIGHYRFLGGREGEARMVCDNPYPSEFDRGIITAVARKFRPGAEVARDESQPTRLEKGDSCSYLVRW